MFFSLTRTNMIGRTSKLAIAQIVPKEKNGNPLLMASDATPEAIVIPIYMAELFNAITVPRTAGFNSEISAVNDACPNPINKLQIICTIIAITRFSVESENNITLIEDTMLAMTITLFFPILSANFPPKILPTTLPTPAKKITIPILPTEIPKLFS